MDGMLSFLLPIAMIFAVFYFFVIRPEKRRMRAREQMLSEIKTGDKIVTNSGFLGEVTGIKGDVMTLLISDKVRVRMLRNQIAGLERDLVKGEGSSETNKK